MYHILRSRRDYCVRMDVGPFMHLSSIMRDKHLFIDTKYVTADEQLAIFLRRIRQCLTSFSAPEKTISWDSENAIRAICAICDDLILSPNGTCHMRLKITLSGTLISK